MAILHRLEARDRALYNWFLLSSSGAPRWRRLAIGVTHLGGGRATVALAGLPLLSTYWWVALGRHALFSLVLSHVVVQLVKRTVGRPRPLLAAHGASFVAAPDRFSFPSGHATASMTVALAYAVVFPSLAIPIIALAGIVGASRVMLGVHYPGDVAAGQAIAVATHLVLLHVG